MPKATPEHTPDQIATLQALLDRSARTATPAVGDSVAYPERQMTAAELLAFWPTVGLVAMATVGVAGQPHVAPVHADLTGTTMRLVVYDNAVRRRDLAANPRVAFTTWNAGAAVILYGRARELPDTMRAARAGRSGRARSVVTVEVRLTRAYAMRPPERAADPSAGTTPGPRP